MAFTTKQMFLFVGALGVLSFIFSFIAENKKPPFDLAVAFGFLVATTLAGGLSLFYPYKGRSILLRAMFQSTSFFVFFLISLCSIVLSATMLLWPTLTEHKHPVRNVHYNLETTAFFVLFLMAL